MNNVLVVLFFEFYYFFNPISAKRIHPQTSQASTPKQSSDDVSEEPAKEPVDFIEIEPEPTRDPQVAIETRIDVIRMTDRHGAGKERGTTEAKPTNSEPMDEALNYLLRQLRDSQQRKAA